MCKRARMYQDAPGCADMCQGGVWVVTQKPPRLKSRIKIPNEKGGKPLDPLQLEAGSSSNMSELK